MQKLYPVFWASFLVAGVAEGLFFTVIDPQELYLFGQEVHVSKIATYSIGFLLFWGMCAAASLLTVFLQRSADEVNQGADSPGKSG